jgi:branched-chain amino acid transport system permease protein
MEFLDMDIGLILAFLPDVLVIGVSIGLVYGLVALGISLIYSGLDIVHFAHGEIFMFGAFFGLVLYDGLGVSYPITLFLAMILTGIMGVVIERVFYRRLTSQGGGYTVAGMGMIICGFGMAIILQNIAFLIWGAEGHTLNVQFGMPLQIGGIALPKSYLWILIVSVTLMALLHFFLKHTKLGLAVRAVAANKDIAYLMGINVPLMISVIFGVACGLAAAGGVLIGPINYVQVEMGYLILIKAFAAAVVGGFGSLPGAILGGLMVGVFETMGATYISGSHKDIYAFLLLIFVLMVRPTGLLGTLAKVKA